MNKKMIFAVVILIVIFTVLWVAGSRDKEKTDFFMIEESRKIAEKWIEEKSPTYVFDGYGLNLKEEETIVEGSVHLFIFDFESRASGYGDRAGEMTAQVITPHRMELIVDKGEVVKAVTDGVYSEVDSTIINDSGKEEETTTIKLFFGKYNQGEDLFAIDREISATQAIGRVALSELVKGPSGSEKTDGYFSLVNPETEILSLFIENGIAYVDFSPELEEGVAGSATVIFIREQIKETLVQFDTVDDIVISIEGRTDDILQP